MLFTLLVEALVDLIEKLHVAMSCRCVIDQRSIQSNMQLSVDL